MIDQTFPLSDFLNLEVENSFADDCASLPGVPAVLGISVRRNDPDQEAHPDEVTLHLEGDQPLTAPQRSAIADLAGAHDVPLRDLKVWEFSPPPPSMLSRLWPFAALAATATGIASAVAYLIP